MPLELSWDEREYLKFLMEQNRPEGNELFTKLRESIREKLESCDPPYDETEDSECWSRNIKVKHSIPLISECSGKIFRDLCRAISKGCVCRIVYFEELMGDYHEIFSTPLKILNMNEFWLIPCLRRGEEEDMSKAYNIDIESIRSVELLDDSPLQEGEKLENLFRRYEKERQNKSSIRLQFTGFKAEWVKRRQWGENQIVREQADGSVILEMEANECAADLHRLILGCGSSVKVLEPDSLIRIIMSNGLRIHNQYTKTHPEFLHETENDGFFDFIFRNEENIAEAAKGYKLPSLSNEWKQKSHCDTEEKASLKPLQDLLENMLLTVRKKGVLSIKKEFDWLNLNPPFLVESLASVLEGLFIEDLEKRLNEEIEKMNIQGKDLLEKIVIRDGCLSLAKKMNPLEFSNHMNRLLK